MATEIEISEPGGVTAPEGFCAGATSAGIKKVKGSLDFAVLYSETPCTAAGLFTANRVKAAPVLLSQKRLASGRAVAIVVNSGCANACTGEEGIRDAEETAALVAASLGASAEDVLVASTGVIGERLPLKAIRDSVRQVVLSRDGGRDFARAIMTTDRVPKEIAVKVRLEGTAFTIGGAAKGAGMIHPDLATLLCFLTTDAAVELGFLRYALKEAADVSFNMLSIDSDTSTNDSLFILANGRAGNEPIGAGTPAASAFTEALTYVCVQLARKIARDAEGAGKLIEVIVSGAPEPASARRAARTIVSSPLVKSAVHGNDPNWGRVMAALGRSGVDIVESKIDLAIGGIEVLSGGRQLGFDKGELVSALKGSEVQVRLDLNLGECEATAWGCDLSEEYVTINSTYTT